MQRIQQTAPTQQLQTEYSIKGRFGIWVGETIHPTTDLGDYAGRSPFVLKRRVGGHRLNIGAGAAGEKVGAIYRAEVNSLVVFEAIQSTQVSGTDDIYEVRLLTDADIALLTSVTAFVRDIPRWNAPQINGARPHLALSFATFTDLGATPGDLLGEWVAKNSDTSRFLMPRGITLDGRAATSDRLNLAINNASINEGARFGIQVSEYVLSR